MYVGKYVVEILKVDEKLVWNYTFEIGHKMSERVRSSMQIFQSVKSRNMGG